MKKIGLLSLAAATVVMAGGYKIPEASLNSIALSAANVAHANGADTAYYNPANMIWQEDGEILEVGLTYIGLTKVKYDPTVGAGIESKSEDFLVPNIHYVSPVLGNARVGLSIVSPAGLSRRWDQAPAIYSAEEFTLQTIEINPSVAIKVNDNMAVAFGMRFVHSSGVVKSTSPLGSRDMEGDGFDIGYNLALSYQPIDALELAATYRSKIDLNIEGNAKLYSDAGVTNIYDGATKVSVPVPASLSLAAAYTFPTKTTVEVIYDRTYWSGYKEINFDYPDNPLLELTAFGQPVAKNWKNANAYRLGVTQEYERWTAMAGIAIDDTPVPEETLSYELPDSDAMVYSLGGRYQVNKQWNVGFAGLYSVKDDHTVSNGSIDGRFSNGKSYLISAAVEYKF